MKKILSVLLIFTMVFCFVACGNQQEDAQEPVPEVDENGMSIATEFEFTIDSENEQVIDNLIFNEDVYIKGDNGKLIFNKCEFNGKLINASKEGAYVFISEWCTFGENFEALIDNGVEEASLDYSLSKFMLLQPMPVTIKGAGAVTSLGDFDLTVNGKTYSKADAQYFLDEVNGGGMEEYDGTQEGNMLYVGSWTENGEIVEFVLLDNIEM